MKKVTWLTGLLLIVLTVVGCGGSSSSNEIEETVLGSNTQILNVKVGNLSIDANSQIPRVTRDSISEGTKALEDIETNMDAVITLSGADYAMVDLEKIDGKHYKLAFLQPATVGSYEVDLNIQGSGGQNMVLPLKYEVIKPENSLKAMLKGKTFYVVGLEDDKFRYPVYIYKTIVSDNGEQLTSQEVDNAVDVATANVTYEDNKLIIDKNSYIVLEKKTDDYIEFKFYFVNRFSSTQRFYYNREKAERYYGDFMLQSSDYTVSATNEDISNHENFSAKITKFSVAGTNVVNKDRVVISTRNSGRFFIDVAWEDWMYGKITYMRFDNGTQEKYDYLQTTMDAFETSNRIECKYLGNFEYICNGVKSSIKEYYQDRKFPVEANLDILVCDKAMFNEENTDGVCDKATLPVIFED